MVTFGVVTIMFTLRISGDDIAGWITAHTNDSLNRMEQIAKSSVCPALEAYAKAHASWTDQTGAARAGLNSNYSRPDRTTFVTDIRHGVDYGIHLENMQSGRFSILRPTVRAMIYPIADMYMEAWR